MALLHRPALLALDEPTTGVDPVSRSEPGASSRQLQPGELPSVATTTYLAEAHRASTVTLLEHGRSIATGAPSEIIAAVAGKLGVVRSATQPQGLSWRWGKSWRVWSPSGVLPEQAEPVQPGFEDAVIIASLAHEQGV